MEKNSDVEEFWHAYCGTRADRDACLREPHDAWAFGTHTGGQNDDARLVDTIGALVLAGTKTTTTGLVWEYESFGWKMPAVGDRAIILGGEGRPLCVIAMTAVVVQPFDAVDAAFAASEGEGWERIEEWRAAHWPYFSRRCHEIGKAPSERMPVICLRFRVVYPREESNAR